ncbi:hypothetical protein FA09DRAFT_324956 [Tilletiopsis washingtonensis]|uniref:Uncharacterized protein n=1 Tax=Tilletiopsis washingtonensis TaxID=58919 RepID=A0A316ZDA5_9BASI|nr:hypothetical protein FA09DRAFT_324956 [Tilletiopsis washingtonensis]PWN99509.1 hypothetical protein FA09DRAFT_324956 [Tilletiopsis washingtonensis]
MSAPMAALPLLPPSASLPCHCVVPVLNRELEVRIRMAKANASAKSLKDNALRMQVSNDAGGLKFLGALVQHNALVAQPSGNPKGALVNCVTEKLPVERRMQAGH